MTFLSWCMAVRYLRTSLVASVFPDPLSPLKQENNKTVAEFETFYTLLHVLYHVYMISCTCVHKRDMFQETVNGQVGHVSEIYLHLRIRIQCQDRLQEMKLNPRSILKEYIANLTIMHWFCLTSIMVV